MENETKVNFKRLEKANEIPIGREVRVTTMNHIIEIMSMSREPCNCLKFRKIDKTRYMDITTGEVYEYKLTENRGQNIKGLKATFKTIRNLINNNFTGASNELFITLSYKENMTDTKKLYRDFEKFIKKMKRRYPDIDYLSIVEPQGRGAWHCHALIRFNQLETVYIKNNDEIWPMWGHGFTKTKSLKDIDNIGAYLKAYLTDVEVTEGNKEVLWEAVKHRDSAWETVQDENGNIHNIKVHDDIELKVVEREVSENGKKVTKKFMKGARLHMYPSGMNLYRCSRGIKKPNTEKMMYFEAKKKVGSSTANFSQTTEISKDGRTVNTITYEHYNLKR